MCDFNRHENSSQFDTGALKPSVKTEWLQEVQERFEPVKHTLWQI